LVLVEVQSNSTVRLEEERLSHSRRAEAASHPVRGRGVARSCQIRNGLDAMKAS
jgi:hypothetical protein